jgi:hypothetical protein
VVVDLRETSVTNDVQTKAARSGRVSVTTPHDHPTSANPIPTHPSTTKAAKQLNNDRSKHQVVIWLCRAAEEGYRGFMGQQYRHLSAKPRRRHFNLRKLSATRRSPLLVQPQRNSRRPYLWRSAVCFRLVVYGWRGLLTIWEQIPCNQLSPRRTYSTSLFSGPETSSSGSATSIRTIFESAGSL